MEFLPGAFEREWERRRALLQHEMQMGRRNKGEWDEPRRGGAVRLLDEGSDGFGRARLRGGGSRVRWSRDGTGSAGRSMRTRFAAMARGSQPAVVKLASYGGGSRAAAMVNYTSRGGELAVENERGERVLGRDALAEQRAEWEHLFDNRAVSRDLGVFNVSIDAASLRSDVDQDAQLREILRSGFGDRRFVYTARERSRGELYVSGVVVLRDGHGERLTGDRKAALIVQQRYDDTDADRDLAVRFRFHGYGNGVEWGTSRVRELVTGADGEVRDDTGRLINDATQAGDLVQKEWRKELHSRKGRDVMHLIVSARAGTDASAFEDAVREFLGAQFVGHRYVFAVHDPALDPKERAEGGKRPHIHAHAIVTMRSQTGERIVTSPQLFREWRSLMAEKAREQGIDMELTDRREFASAPAYTRNQVRPVSYRSRTEHEGTSHAAHARYQAKRSNEMSLASTDRSRQYAATAAQAWNDLASEAAGIPEGKFAMLQKVRLVEAVLASVSQTLDGTEWTEFDEVASAAREVVDIRREYLEFTERQGRRDDRLEDANAHWDAAVARFGLQAVETANEVLVEVNHYREGLERIDAEELPQHYSASYQAGLAREVRRAAEMAVDGDNQYMRDVAKSDQELQRAIEMVEIARKEAQKSADGERSPVVSTGEVNQAKAGGASGDGAAEIDRTRDGTEDDRAAAERDEDERQVLLRLDQAHRRSTARLDQGRPVPDIETARSDPPQQQVPRLRQIEQEIQEREDRDRDDRDR